jgi:2-(1,2-epoxy-1,2-dihydrophenyl)acetyl-CoA isomerase
MASVELEIDDGIATVTLNRPDVGNALDLPLMQTLRGVADQLAQTGGVRVVMLRANGSAFSVGGDLRWMTEQSDRLRAIHQLASELHGAMLAFRALDAPLVSVVHGTAAGAGVSLAAFTDIAVAGESATFLMAYTKVGLSPDGGSTWLLPRLIGRQRASAMILLNRQVTAREAADLGLVARVFGDDALAAEAMKIAETLRDGSLSAHRAVKLLMDASWTSSFAEQLDREASSISSLADGPEGREGIGAFLERRRPDFRSVTPAPEI